jgi:phage/plasmid-associated DNA primase
LRNFRKITIKVFAELNSREKDLQLKRLTDKLRNYKEKNSALLIQFDSRVVEYDTKLKYKDAQYNSYKQYINDHIESITSKMKEHEGQ